MSRINNITYISNALYNLPVKLKLCNEIMLHDKVYNNKYDYLRLIPKGNKCILYFKTYKSQSVAYLIYIHTRTNKVLNIYQYNICFNKYLTNGLIGTILYGTFVEQQIDKSKSHNIFSVEDIYYYKSEFIANKSWKEKMEYYNDLFSNNLRMKCYNNNIDMICVMPITIENSNNNNNNNMIKLREIEKYYKVYSIQYLLYNKIYTKIYKYFQNDIEKLGINNKISENQLFMVKADINNDIYKLYYIKENNNYDYYDIMYIKNYERSVYMNSYFRNIKENSNLDLLEESDDEEEFQNTSADKYVDLNKKLIFECVYNKKFKMWEPLKYISKVEG